MLLNCSFLFLALLLVSCGEADDISVPHDSKLSSSVWCSPDKLCSFQNLCYHSESRQFLFVLSSFSILQGLNNSDLHQLELSSVPAHNRMFMNLTVISQFNKMLLGAVFKDESLFAIHSFKRDNIMHVIHDDLLPLYSTYLLLCGDNVQRCIDSYRLTFVNDQVQGPYEKWYRVFSKKDPLLLSHLDYDSPVICYREVRIGLVRSSLWFDYGFLGVQGRLKNPKISGRVLRKFRDFILSAMNVAPVVGNERCTVFIKRTVNRRILNEEFVKEAITQSRKNACLIEIDLLKDSSESFLAVVHQSNLLVGMHGAGMALSVFLPIGATIIELFPFAINPYNVSPIMAMCDLDDIGLHYVFWRNLNRSSSIPPSTTDPLGGSISHLPTTHQNKILQLDKVDAVPCCHDPAYLYYMFQDTIVSSDFKKTVVNALQRSKHFYIEDFILDSYDNLKRIWMSPGSVYNIVCNFKNATSFEVSWNEPVNSADFDHLEYEVLALGRDQPVFSGTVQGTQVKASTSEHINKLKLWICALEKPGKLKSKDVFFECFNEILK